MRAVNLLPADLRGAAKAPGKVKPSAPTESGPGPFLLLGGLALAVALLAGYVLTTNTVKQREAELAAVEARHQAALQRAVELKPYADFKALAEKRVETVRSLAEQRFDWEQGIRDLSRAVPADVTLDELTGSVAQSGGGGNQLRQAIGAPAIELKGCTLSQTGVARLMARLRNVEGVTRVSLSKSAKEDNQADQAVDSGPGATTKPEGCGPNDPPVFEVVAFFEGEADKSAEPTGPVAAKPAATNATGAAAPAATPTPGASASTTTGATTP